MKKTGLCPETGYTVRIYGHQLYNGENMGNLSSNCLLKKTTLYRFFGVYTMFARTAITMEQTLKSLGLIAT